MWLNQMEHERKTLTVVFFCRRTCKRIGVGRKGRKTVLFYTFALLTNVTLLEIIISRITQSKYRCSTNFLMLRRMLLHARYPLDSFHLAMQLHVQNFIQQGQHSWTSVIASSASVCLPDWSACTLLRGLVIGAEVRAKLRTVLDALESLFAASMTMES